MDFKDTISTMKKLFILAIGFLPFFAFSQKPPIKFGDFTKEEIDMEYYALDSSAAAVVLTDYGHAYINIHTSRLVFERHIRIKVLKKEGLEWADFSIPLYQQGGKSENVSNLKAVTYNFQNDVKSSTKMSKNSIFTEKFNNYYNLYKFALEDVRVGSILEVSYKVHSDFFFNFPSWRFQRTIPVIWSEYRADIPDFFVYERYMQGYLPIAINESKKTNTGQYNYEAHRWAVKDAPAFKAEPYMTCEEDYISKINFALSHYKLNGIYHDYMGSWEKIKKQLLESSNVGGVVSGSSFLNKAARELTDGLEDPKQKVKAIYDYVKENLMWNGESDFTSDNLRNAFKEGKGSSADINLALASMLQTAKLDVDLVFLSTRDHGFVRQQFSMLRQFNYVICAVNLENERLLLDATHRNMPIEILPERCLNGYGLLVSKNKPIDWVKLEETEKSKTMISANLTLDETGLLEGEVSFVRNRYDAYNMRNEYIAKGEEEYLKRFMERTSWDILGNEFKGINTIEEQVQERYEVSIHDRALMAGDLAYIKPYLISDVEENPFKSLVREYPVDFSSPFEKIYLSQIAIPENFVVEDLPDRKVISLPDNAARFTFNIANNGNTIIITSNLSINKSLFVQSEYQNLREFYNQIVAMQAEQIVLKKVN